MKFLCQVETNSGEAKDRKGWVSRFAVVVMGKGFFPIRWYPLNWKQTKIDNEMVKLNLKLDKLYLERQQVIRDSIALASEASSSYDGMQYKSIPREMEGNLLPITLKAQPKPDSDKLEKLLTFLSKGNPQTAFEQTLSKIDKLRSDKAKTVAPKSSKKLTEVGEVNVADVDFVDVKPRSMGDQGNQHGNKDNQHGNKDNQQHGKGNRPYEYREPDNL